MKYLKTYLDSFKNIKLIAQVALFDLFLIILVYLGIIITKIILKSPLSVLNAVNLETPKTLPELQLIVSNLKDFFTSAAIALTLLFIIITLAYSIFEGAAFSKILKKKLTLNYLKRFALINAVWFLLFIASAVIILLSFQKSAIAISLVILIFAFLYFTLLISYFVTKENKIRKAFKISTIKHLLVPIIFIIITSFIITKLNILYKSLSAYITTIIDIILFLFVFSWIKIYTANTIGFIQK